MNVIAPLDYELAYYDSAVHRFNHYTTRTIPFYIFGTVYIFYNSFWDISRFIVSSNLVLSLAKNPVHLDNMFDYKICETLNVMLICKSNENIKIRKYKGICFGCFKIVIIVVQFVHEIETPPESEQWFRILAVSFRSTTTKGSSDALSCALKRWTVMICVLRVLAMVLLSWLGSIESMNCTAVHLRSRSLNIVSLSDMIESSYNSWDLYTTGQLVDGLQQKKKKKTGFH